MITNRIFIEYYQDFLTSLCLVDPDITPPDIFPISGDKFKIKDGQLMVEAVWRLMSAGLIGCYDFSMDQIVGDMVKEFILKDGFFSWSGFNFNPVHLGETLLKECGLNENNYEDFYDVICDPLKEALTDLFNKAGVGFDKECPYKIPLPSK